MTGEDYDYIIGLVAISELLFCSKCPVVAVKFCHSLVPSYRCRFVIWPLANLFLTSKATIDVPTNVALQYNHRLPRTPETRAGANERAGFIEAPDINARKNMSSPTIPPITRPLYPLSPIVYTTTTTTAINNADANTLESH